MIDSSYFCSVFLELDFKDSTMEFPPTLLSKQKNWGSEKVGNCLFSGPSVFRLFEWGPILCGFLYFNNCCFLDPGQREILVMIRLPVLTIRVVLKPRPFRIAVWRFTFKTYLTLHLYLKAFFNFSIISTRTGWHFGSERIRNRKFLKKCRT